MNAIAPSAASGATRMIMPTTANSACSRLSITLSSGSVCARKRDIAMPSSTENRMIWSMSFRANASTTLVGMILRKNSATPSLPCVAAVAV